MHGPECTPADIRSQMAPTEVGDPSALARRARICSALRDGAVGVAVALEQQQQGVAAKLHEAAAVGIGGDEQVGEARA